MVEDATGEIKKIWINTEEKIRGGGGGGLGGGGAIQAPHPGRKTT